MLKMKRLSNEQVEAAVHVVEDLFAEFARGVHYERQENGRAIFITVLLKYRYSESQRKEIASALAEDLERLVPPAEEFYSWVVACTLKDEVVDSFMPLPE